MTIEYLSKKGDIAKSDKRKKKRPGRPKGSKNKTGRLYYPQTRAVQVRFSEELIDRINAYGTDHQLVSFSETVRTILRNEISRWESEGGTNELS